MAGKAVKILFLLNHPSKIVPTYMDLFICGRAGHGSKKTSKFLEDETFAEGFGWEVVTRNRIFLNDGESSEKIISREPPIQNCSNLYGPLHLWQGWVSEQTHFQNSLKIRHSRTVSVGRSCDENLDCLG